MASGSEPLCAQARWRDDECRTSIRCCRFALTAFGGLKFVILVLAHSRTRDLHSAHRDVHVQKHTSDRILTLIEIMLRSKRITALGSCAVLLVVIGLWLVLRNTNLWPAKGKPPAHILAFWDRFYATNAAWLDPQPPAFSYEIVLQQKDRDFRTQTNFWRDSSVLKTWCTPEKNLRFIEHYFDSHGAVRRTTEYRYFHGRGNEVTLPSRGRKRELRLNQWLAGRNGVGFLSTLHLLAAWGVPKNTTLIEQADGTLLLRVFDLSQAGRQWRKDIMVSAAYGLHPASFSTEMPMPAAGLEVTIDAATLLPVTMREIDHSGATMATIVFDSPWLEAQGHKMPRKVRCRLPRIEQDLRYEFSVQQGIWLLKELEIDVPGSYSLCRRSYTRNLQVGSIPDSNFPDPADREIPEHSFTTLAPGERLVTVRTTDGLSLEGKLSLPPQATNPVPVVFFLPGAGPFTFDRPIVYPDLTRLNELLPPMKVQNYCDFYAQQLAARGLGFFRINQRGCGIIRDDEGHPREITNRSLFSKATPKVLLADYQAALDALRHQAGVDTNRIILLGASAGTRWAPRLALAKPDGIVAVVMFGYSEDGMKNTIVWQNTVGPWRNIAKIFDADEDGKVTQAEYDEVLKRKGKIVSDLLPFDQLDRNRNRIVTPTEMDQRPHAEEILKAVQNRDDDSLWDNLLNLSSTYLLEEWESPPTHETLLKLDVLLAIFHGENDGACRVEGALAAQRAFQAAGKSNLTVRTYPKTDHDLNWASYLRDGKVPPAFADMFDYLAKCCFPTRAQ